MTKEEIQALSPYATDKERTYLLAIESYGSFSKAAEAAEVNQRTLERALQRIRKRAAAKDPKQHTHKAPIDYRLRGASTLLDGSGNVLQQWVKTERDKASPEEWIALFKEALETADLPRAIISKAPGFDFMPDLLAIYPWGDPHFGMHAWGKEAGQDYNLEIAERGHKAATDYLVSVMQPAETALFINLGDASHANTSAAMTAAGTRVDVDSRWGKVQLVLVRCLIYAIKKYLTKHKTVHVINAPGNHDPDVATYLNICLALYFENEPRVIVDTSPSTRLYLEFGANLVGATHGNGAKAKDLPAVMAVERREAWGRTRNRYWYTGHIHHEMKREYGGAIVESFNTWAPQDAWHAGQGYMARQAMVADTMHREHGRVSRFETNPLALGL
jgi:hypothetical protein